jgi:peptide/nickel transport system substrate-binding protein
MGRSGIKSFALVVGGTVVVACGAAGCGGSSTQNPAPSGAASAAGSSSGAAAPAGKPVRGGKLVLGVDSEPVGFDPATDVVPSPGSASITDAVFDTLTAPTKDGSYQPYLAKSITPNADSTVWTIGLRPDLKFADGTPIDAAAVKANLERQKLHGFQGFPDMKSATVVDPLTVKVTMNDAWGSFPAALASQRGWIYSPTAVEKLGKGFSAHPVGSGPFEVEKWTRGSSILLKRNPNYWRKGLPYLDQVEFRIIPDDSARLDALKSGDLDSAQIASKDISTLSTGDFHVQQATAYVDLLYLNTTKPPLDNVNVRRALAYALNRKAIINTAWAGVGPVADGPGPPSNPFAAKVNFPSDDQAKAKQLVAGFGKPVDVTLSSQNDPTSQLFAQSVQSMWKSAGINAKLASPSEAGAHADQVIGGKYQAATFGFPPFLDPDSWWSQIIASKGAINVMHYKDPIIDAALAKAHSLSDTNARKAQYAIIERRMADQVYAIFVHGDVVAEGASADVGGLGGMTLPEGQPAPYGQEDRIPFNTDSMWRQPAN